MKRTNRVEHVEVAVPMVGIERVDDPHNLDRLVHAHDDAGRPYDELVGHDGWIGGLSWAEATGTPRQPVRTPAWWTAV